MIVVSTRASLQFLMYAMTKADTKVEMKEIEIGTLSEIPSWIKCVSLEKLQGVRIGSDQIAVRDGDRETQERT